MYGSYVPKVNARNAILSDFTIDIELEHTGLDYTATVVMDNVGGNTSSNLKLHLVVTESKLPIVWGLTQVQDFTNRLMVPNQNGTPLDFTGGNVQTVVLDFTVAGFWDTDNCEVIAFIQDNVTKEIKQGTKKFMAVPLYNIDAQAKAVKHPVGLYCGNSVEPIVLIKNMGGDELTSLDIEYSINGGDPQTYAWTGSLGFNLGEEVTLPEISFESQPVNSFEFSVSNPNGQPDPNPENDYLMGEFEAAPQISNVTVNFELKTDNYPSETTWELKNSAGNVLYSGGPYSSANTIYTETWELQETDCYTYTIYDAYGDGICCDYGIGYYRLMDEENNIFIEGGEFGSEESKPFERFDENALIADFTADVTSIVEGESVNFTDLSAGNITIWYWEFEGGVPATSTAQNPTITYNIEGVYDVTLTISDGSNMNMITKEEYITVDHITGINDPNSSQITIYPNPTSGKVFVSGADNASVVIYNTAGKVVASWSNFSATYIDLSGLNEGIYFMNIIIDDKSVVNEKISLMK